MIELKLLGSITDTCLSGLNHVWHTARSVQSEEIPEKMADEEIMMVKRERTGQSTARQGSLKRAPHRISIRFA